MRNAPIKVCREGSYAKRRYAGHGAGLGERCYGAAKRFRHCAFREVEANEGLREAAEEARETAEGLRDAKVCACLPKPPQAIA